MNETLFVVALISVLSLGLVAGNSYAGGMRGGSGFMMFDGSNLVGAPVKDSQGKMTGFVDEVMVDSGDTPLRLSTMQTMTRSNTVEV